jgi:3-oxoacyl-[acyl-carrier-protein] synthase II
LSGDAHHLTSPDPSGAGAYRSIQSALRHAELSPEKIDYVNAHATSTPAGDFVELAALQRLLGAASARKPVSSTKSATGHLLGGAGAIEAIFSILALRDQVAPPTLNLHKPEEESPFNLVPMEAQDCRMSHVASNSFGFGGTNATLVFGQAP